MAFHGVVTARDLQRRVDELPTFLATVGPGFSLTTDLTDLELMDLDTVPAITRVMDLCLQAGVKQIVRIIPDPSKDIGFHLLSLTHYRGRVPITTCATRAEAEALLAPR
jgi:hypothetical protein